jgi:hypothetical protein
MQGGILRTQPQPSGSGSGTAVWLPVAGPSDATSFFSPGYLAGEARRVNFFLHFGLFFFRKIFTYNPWETITEMDPMHGVMGLGAVSR